MIVELHGHSMAEARRVFTQLLEKMPAPPRKYEPPAHIAKIVKQRLRAKILGTRKIRRAIEDLLDALDRKFAARAKKMTLRTKPKESLREAEGDEDEVTDSIIGDSLGDDLLSDSIHPTTIEMFNAGVESATAELNLSFTVKPKAAIKALDAYDLALSKEFSKRAKTRIKALVREGLETGWTGADLSQAILDEGLAQSVPILDAAGNVLRTMSAEQWANLVSRTESSRALNAGVLETYRQSASDLGVQRMIFLAADDDRVCDECEELDGTSIEIGETWGDSGEETPPIHGNCRCGTVLDYSAFDNPEGTE